MARTRAVPLKMFIWSWSRCSVGICRRSCPRPDAHLTDQIGFVRLLAALVLVIVLKGWIMEMFQWIIDLFEDMLPLIEIALEG